jgi:hypothetical protein
MKPYNKQVCNYRENVFTKYKIVTYIIFLGWYLEFAIFIKRRKSTTHIQ